MRQQFGLIKAALPLLSPVHRHGHYYIEILIKRQRLDHEPAKGHSQTFYLRVFEEMN
jgi:hypothetical protein